MGQKISGYSAVKVFSATKMEDRMRLGETVTSWIAGRTKESGSFEIVDTVVTQSSDEAFHCLAITVFYLS